MPFDPSDLALSRVKAIGIRSTPPTFAPPISLIDANLRR